jgi:hypothetical protein
MISGDYWPNPQAGPSPTAGQMYGPSPQVGVQEPPPHNTEGLPLFSRGALGRNILASPPEQGGAEQPCGPNRSALPRSPDRPWGARYVVSLLLSNAHWLLSNAHWLWPIGYGLLAIAYCLLSVVCCLLAIG